MHIPRASVETLMGLAACRRTAKGTGWAGAGRKLIWGIALGRLLQVVRRGMCVTTQVNPRVMRLWGAKGAFRQH